MDIITLDLETYYDKDYSLRKMTTEAYIRDPRFEVIGVGLKVNDNPTDWYSGDDVEGYLHSIDYSDKAILAHNTAFDGAILSWLYNIKPRLWLDTLSMSRPSYQMTVGGSLDKLSKKFKLGYKGDEVHAAIGKRRTDFTPEELAKYAEYCIQDVELTYKLFKRLANKFPSSEIQVIDQTLRMFTEPTIQLDTNVLSEHLSGIRSNKKRLMDKLGGEDKIKSHLMSNQKFAALLEKLGVIVPLKISPTTGKHTYAFAKTDEGFKLLLSHDRPVVRALCEARLAVKSTIDETRTVAFMGIAERGPLPIMLKYYGAHTGRFSGSDKVNLQNLPRGGKLRAALTSQYGQRVVACDSSQIEARVVAWLAGEEALLEQFRNNIDVYSEFASAVYGRPITKADKLERHVGKTAILGLGYGMGKDKFKDSLKSGYPSVDISIDQADEVVKLYRSTNRNINLLWSQCQWMLGAMVRGDRGTICNDVLPYDEFGITLPNKLQIQYPALRELDQRSYGYINRPAGFYRLTAKKITGDNSNDGIPWVNIYGGKVVENITQAVARIVVAEQMVRIGQRYKVALQVHDEVVCIVDESEAEAARDYMVEVMSTPPTWAKDLPVACEADIGVNYGDAK